MTRESADVLIVGAGLSGAVADRERRQGTVYVRWIGRVAGHARDPEVPIDPVIIRNEVSVADRAVVGDAVEGADPEVGRQKPRLVGAVEDRAAADAVEHHRLHLGIRFVNRIICRRAPHVRAGVPLLERRNLPVAFLSPILLGVAPLSVLQAHNLDAGLG